MTLLPAFRPLACALGLVACLAAHARDAGVVGIDSTFVRDGSLLSLASFYIAWKPDGGTDWHFADGYGLRDPDAIHDLFPDYHDNFVLPPLQDAKFVPQ